MGAYFAVKAVGWIAAVLVFPFWLGLTDTPWFVAAAFGVMAGLSFWLSDFLLLPDLRRGGIRTFLYMWFAHVLRIAPPVALAFIVGRVVH